jgi:hypothetical protein
MIASTIVRGKKFAERGWVFCGWERGRDPLDHPVVVSPVSSRVHQRVQHLFQMAFFRDALCGHQREQLLHQAYVERSIPVVRRPGRYVDRRGRRTAGRWTIKWWHRNTSSQHRTGRVLATVSVPSRSCEHVSCSNEASHFRAIPRRGVLAVQQNATPSEERYTVRRPAARVTAPRIVALPPTGLPVSPDGPS